MKNPTLPNACTPRFVRHDSGLIVLRDDAPRIATDIPASLRAKLMGGVSTAPAPSDEGLATSVSNQTIAALTNQAALVALAHAPDAMRHAAIVGAPEETAAPLIALAGNLPPTHSTAGELIVQPSLNGDTFTTRALFNADPATVRAALQRGGQQTFTQPRSLTQTIVER